MRRVARSALPKKAQTYLDQRQAAARLALGQGVLNVEREWKTARQTKAVEVVLNVLREMMGPRERCMYCVDSHGCDIEHFWPKSRYPKRAFQWANLLLCCTDCGRFKGDQFPMMNRRPLLIDPTAEDPWLHLDFDPDTGNVVARFDLQANDWSAKGAKTVEVLRLDRREALEVVYKATFKRLSRVVQTQLDSGAIDALSLQAELQDADDHGLLRWCFGPSGEAAAPFSALYRQHPHIWAECERAF